MRCDYDDYGDFTAVYGRDGKKLHGFAYRNHIMVDYRHKCDHQLLLNRSNGIDYKEGIIESSRKSRESVNKKLLDGVDCAKLLAELGI